MMDPAGGRGAGVLQGPAGIKAMFDGISYQKGGSVLRMLRAYLNRGAVPQPHLRRRHRRRLLQVTSGWLPCLCTHGGVLPAQHRSACHSTCSMRGEGAGAGAADTACVDAPAGTVYAVEAGSIRLQAYEGRSAASGGGSYGVHIVLGAQLAPVSLPCTPAFLSACPCVPQCS